MKPYTVTHISTVHPAFDVRIFYKECCSLAAHGLNVNLIVTHDKDEFVDSVRIISLPQFKTRGTRILIKPVLALFKALKTKADLYHFHDPELIPLGLLLKLLGKKVIYDVHEDVSSQILDKYWIPKKLRKSVSSLFKCIENFSAKRFNGVITATPYIKNIFEIKNKNTIDVNNYPLLSEACFSHHLKKGKKEKVVSYIGGITKERGIFEVLKALEGTDIKLYWAGNTSPATLIKTLQQCPGWENVVHYGYVSRQEVYSILSESQVGICTSYPIKNYFSSYPVKVFEYMNSGIPLIVSRFPVWEELLKDIGNTLFVDPFNPEEIRSAMEALLSNPERTREMGERGKKAVKEKYNWENESHKLINFYKKILE